VRVGHPWVFAGQIEDRNREGRDGEIAALYDFRDRFIGLGLYDSASPLRVRVLHRGEPVIIDSAWWAQHLEAALARRAGVFGGDTTAWRWIHGENDGWPGLVMDRYASVLVLKLYTVAWLPCLEELVALIRRHLEPRTVVLRLSRNIQTAASREYGRTSGMVLWGEPVTGAVRFLERGMRFEADVVQGQKTGFFLDQRENREIVEHLARNGTVLNAFSFSGAFSVFAARGGARSVIDLDISGHALESARRNFALNRHHPAVAAARHETVQADAWHWLRTEAGEFELVILDPPAFARNHGERAGALAAYRGLAMLGARRLGNRGILLACSCSAHVADAEFFEAVRSGVARAGVKFTELRVTGQPVDHPGTFAEGRYLKAIYLRVHSRFRREQGRSAMPASPRARGGGSTRK
jgi:23S rRNA (cytosine1962-C5)-methyltransferase